MYKWYVLVITKGDSNVNLEIPNESKNIYSNIKSNMIIKKHPIIFNF